MVKGDKVLITFPFTNLTGSKLRPTDMNYGDKIWFVKIRPTAQGSTNMVREDTNHGGKNWG